MAIMTDFGAQLDDNNKLEHCKSGHVSNKFKVKDHIKVSNLGFLQKKKTVKNIDQCLMELTSMFK